MIPIYICEDDLTHKQNIEYMINRKIIADDLDMEIKLSSDSPEKILALIKQKHMLGIYFLDIELTNSKMNGLTLAREIRQYDPDGYIVFITTHSEMSYLTFQYKVGALDFIIKDQLKKVGTQIEECIDVINERLQTKREQKQDLFVTNDGELTSHICFDDIYCFEAMGNHRVLLMAQKEEFSFSGALTEIEKQLDNRFFRCHRSYIINLKNVVSVDEKKRFAFFKDGTMVPISKMKMNEFKKKISLQKPFR